MPASNEILHAALIDLSLAAQFVRRIRCGGQVIEDLKAALHRTEIALKALDKQGIGTDLKGLVELAAQADAEARARAHFRADVDG